MLNIPKEIYSDAMPALFSSCLHAWKGSIIDATGHNFFDEKKCENVKINIWFYQFFSFATAILTW